jgi:D-alanyl-lipoteichoic acid acyltransferase DltB (MBOAT superfamily)
MIFTELNFWGFLIIVLALYIVLPHKGQNRMLLIASYVFYGAWDWRFLSLILLSSIVDYLVGLNMYSQTKDEIRRRLLWVSMGFNLGMLGIFKYLGFFVDSFHALLMQVGYDADPIVLSIVLPVGISFYTFQTMSYTLDIYNKKLSPTNDFFDFALFVAFFPQLVAGPIERASNLLPNITMPRTLTWDGFRRGVILCLLGLIKKLVIADGIAPSVNAIYAHPDPSQLDIVFATWLFAIQIYCDFSGYSDIARGVSKMMGFNLMRNFAQPYFAADPQEFWRRWHISLSSWLRDYLYIPLGGNRKGPKRTYINLMATMGLGGLWHGAAWNFIAWGVYQGSLLSIHRVIAGKHSATGEGESRSFFSWIKRVLAILMFFQVVCYGWLLFRATSFTQITDFTGKILGITSGPQDLSIPSPPLAALLGVCFLFLWDLMIERTADSVFYRKFNVYSRVVLYALMIYLLAFGATSQTSAFIYFQF